MLIQILGTGCPKCIRMTEVAEAAAKELGVDFQLEKVMEIRRIMAFGVMTTPSLVVDGTVKVSGRVPDMNEMKKFLA